MNALLALSDAQLIEQTQLTEAELDELERELVIRAGCLGWTGNPMLQPPEVVADIVRGILSRRS